MPRDGTADEAQNEDKEANQGWTCVNSDYCGVRCSEWQRWNRVMMAKRTDLDRRPFYIFLKSLLWALCLTLPCHPTPPSRAQDARAAGGIRCGAYKLFRGPPGGTRRQGREYVCLLLLWEPLPKAHVALSNETF